MCENDRILHEIGGYKTFHCKKNVFPFHIKSFQIMFHILFSVCKKLTRSFVVSRSIEIVHLCFLCQLLCFFFKSLILINVLLCLRPHNHSNKKWRPNEKQNGEKCTRNRLGSLTVWYRKDRKNRTSGADKQCRRWWRIIWKLD